jgi:hypothetical protein
MMSETILLLAKLLIYISLLTFTIYTVIFGYHWFNFGTNRATSITAMVVFLSGAVALFLTLITAYQFL